MHRGANRGAETALYRSNRLDNFEQHDYWVGVILIYFNEFCLYIKSIYVKNLQNHSILEFAFVILETMGDGNIGARTRC